MSVRRATIAPPPATTDTSRLARVLGAGQAAAPTGAYRSARARREEMLAEARAAGARAFAEGQSEQQLEQRAREQALLEEMNTWSLERVSRFGAEVSKIEGRLIRERDQNMTPEERRAYSESIWGPPDPNAPPIPRMPSWGSMIPVQQ